MAQTETLEQVNREGRERLYPSLTNPSWLVLRKRRELFQKWFEKLPHHDLRVLDVGGRIQPYRSLLPMRLSRYVAVDLRGTPLVHVVARAEQLPLANDHFDVAFCTQVLQYIPDPRLVIAETYRVLKPGGFLLLSVPSALPRDSDEECWRFLPEGLRELLGAFAHVELEPEGGSVAGFFRTINVCLNIFARYRAIRSLFRYSIYPMVNLSGAMLEQLANGRNNQFAVNYSIFAQK